MSKLDLAWVQFDISWNDPEKNFAAVETAMAAGVGLEKSGENPRLLVLPEMFSTGFSMKVDRVADDGRSFQWAKKLASDHQIYLLAPLVMKTPNGRGRNMALLFGPGGELLFQYQKIHPFSYVGEHQYYDRGEEIVVVPVGKFLVSVLICYDLRFPEIFRRAAYRGVNLFLVPANWPEPRDYHFRQLLIARAIENQAFVLGVNRLGRDPAVVYGGGSVLIDPRGKVLADSQKSPGLFKQTIDSEDVDSYRREFPALVDVQPRFLGLAGQAGSENRDLPPDFF